MKTYKKIILASVAACALLAAGSGQAETITTKTVVSQKPLPNVNQVNFEVFDINHDGILSTAEVGEKLFKLFDTDGNEVIDNIEFNNKKVMTIIPMEKKTITSIDYNNDGAPEETAFNYDTFVQESHLARFDKNMDGLSPAEFIGKSFLKLDTDNSHAIELDEWKKSYTAMVHPLAADPDYYNN